MTDILDSGLNLRRAVAGSEPVEDKKSTKKVVSENEKWSFNSSYTSTKKTKKTSSKPAKNRRSKSTLKAIDDPDKVVFSAEEKAAYCDAKYGVGKWYIMSREECMAQFREDMEKKRLLKEVLMSDSKGSVKRRNK